MTTRISVPLSKMNEKFIKELKKKYPGHVRLDIQVVDMDAIPTFTEDNFWSIIALLDWDAKGGREEVLATAIAVLSEHPESHIYLFEDMLSEKLFQLDTKAHAAAAYPEDGHFSEDGFLYIRASVVATGKERFEAVLKNPSLMPSDEDFEPLLSLAALAYERKTKSPFDYMPPISYETYANEAGWL
ncbi:MAG: DUF4240 domain-containing protein [Lewinellaceae bacterium]|nr:DUF4240 domain-containing protein [Lewinellaceae bacterium]